MNKLVGNNREGEKGSILILTLLILVGALSIGVAISAVSVLERKMTTKSRRSVSAFQAANAGVEWAMKQIDDAEPDKKVTDVFGFNADSGEVVCPDDLFSDSSDSSCKVILLQRSSGGGQDEWQKINSDIPVKDLVAVRVKGFYKQGSEEVSRALEAYAMPNCDSNEERVADFCVDKSYVGSQQDWGDAVEACADLGKRLCSAAELKAVEGSSLTLGNDIGSRDEWAADASSGGQRIYFGHSGLGESPSGTDHDFRCCRNR